MAGKGFAPRTGDNVRVIVTEPCAQPSLPDWQEWHPATVAWWAMWTRFPMAPDFTESDWSFLLDTAVLHDAFSRGELKYGAEIRLRVAKYGVTAEDRARLRVTFAQADTAEEKATERKERATAAERRRLRVVGE